MLDARVWMKKSDKNFIGRGRVKLLEKIDECGSILSAAKAMKMSYRSAWDAVDAMNNLSTTPLVEKVSGGKGGGGTKITQRGREIIDSFHKLEDKHRQFLELFSDESDSLDSLVLALDKLSLKLSARNQLIGVVVGLQSYRYGVKLEIDLKGVRIFATVTKESFDYLNIKLNDKVIAIIKASLINISKSLPANVDENLLYGVVKDFNGDSDEVIVEFDAGVTIAISNLKHKYTKSDKVVVWFDAKSVIIGI